MKRKPARRKARKPRPRPEGMAIRLLAPKLAALRGYHGAVNFRELGRRVGVGLDTLRMLHTGGTPARTSRTSPRWRRTTTCRSRRS